MNKTNDTAKDFNPRDLLPQIPGVDECIHLIQRDLGQYAYPLSLIKACIREELDRVRGLILSHRLADANELGVDRIVSAIMHRIRRKDEPKLKKVINCTGVIVHTNLGRSVLPPETAQSLVDVATGYSNLEFDLNSGKRGSRYSLVEELLCELTGADAAMVVNNNAAAVLLCLDTLAKGSEVIVSRGQLVEIGGSFRIPDVMARSGAELVEVGATNRTHLADYEKAISQNTSLLLKVHCSNYRIIGFTKEVSNEELVHLGKKHHIPVMEDLGSGCFVDLSKFGLMKEPTVQEVVSSGVDVITFSGDKLLGGPQAGIILGQKDVIDRIKKNPLTRALRIDKFTLAALESILRLYRDPVQAFQQVPTLAMISEPLDDVKTRARELADELIRDLGPVCRVGVEDMVSRIGGGAMPEQDLASSGVVLQPDSISMDELEKRFRGLDIPIIGRVEHNKMVLDVRTIRKVEHRLLVEKICEVFATGSSGNL